MNIKYYNSIFFKLCLISLILLSSISYAVDMEVLQEQCADIGFKIHTPANGKCVLRLMKSVKAEEKAVAVKEQAYTNFQAELEAGQAAQEAAQATQSQQAEVLRQQQAEMYELQRRSVVAQEQAAQAQTDAVGDQQRQRYLDQFNDGIQKMTGTGAYAPKPPTRVHCVTNYNEYTCK